MYKSDFALKNKHIRFWVKDFSACQISKEIAYQKSRFVLLLRENDIKCKYGAFPKIMVLKVNFTARHISNSKEYKASRFELKENNATDFDLNILQRVRFLNKNITTCQILNWWKIQCVTVTFWIRRNNASNFALKKTTRQILKIKNTTRQILNKKFPTCQIFK